MKFSSRLAFKRLAIASAVVFVASLAVIFWRLSGIYGCAGQAAAKDVCSHLESVGTVVRIASWVTAVAFLTLIAAVIGVILKRPAR